VLTAAPALATARVEKFQTLVAALNTDGATMSADTTYFYKRAIMD
jgi:hypothetical protein